MSIVHDYASINKGMREKGLIDDQHEAVARKQQEQQAIDRDLPPDAAYLWSRKAAPKKGVKSLKRTKKKTPHPTGPAPQAGTGTGTGALPILTN